MKSFSIRILFFLFALSLFGCGEDHLITNTAVEILELKYNAAHDYCIAMYSLDIGARGSRIYKSLMKTERLDENLFEGNIPTGIKDINWLDDSTVSVKYDSFLERANATGNSKLIPMFERQDTVQVGQIRFIVVARNEK
jgi:hypothetical protein